MHIYTILITVYCNAHFYLFYNHGSLLFRTSYSLSLPYQLGINLFLINMYIHLTVAAQRVFLSTTKPTPCYNDTVNLICHYPDIMKRVNGQLKYSVTTPSWRKNGRLFYTNREQYSLRGVNQTAVQLTVSITRAYFPDNAVSFTCYLLLTGGGEDNATAVIYPQGVALIALSVCSLLYVVCI